MPSTETNYFRKSEPRAEVKSTLSFLLQHLGDTGVEAITIGTSVQNEMIN